uniref:Non-haem dioxygenase N-terminal domain-containing protein n=1 Tax=Aegilops tauschii subsp. strangulata TaxID=200361 RepID=A0A453GZL4_AEGTS
MASDYDRLGALKAFDDTKAGVKGLVDAGVTTIPSIFHHPLPIEHTDHDHHFTIPVIDLAAATGGTTTTPSKRTELVAAVKAAAETVGFFQVVNHGVPKAVMSEILAAVRGFHEEPAEAKAPYYSRDLGRPVRYWSNFDLFQSPAAQWRDTLYMETTPELPPPEEIPPACRLIALEYARLMQQLGRTLLELLSEALGLRSSHLEEDAACLERLAGHYYPSCPEPHLTLGTTRHSDPCFLTVLLQDAVGGLQVLLKVICCVGGRTGDGRCAGGECRRLPADRLQRQVQERGAPRGGPEHRASRLRGLLLPKTGRAHVYQSAKANRR